ncbi:YisL family protein [Cytobacillus spongiae]|jgi:hypothetical protein|uniref:YisL family protein n=1 Tax=Cytobacillus spongiae TaxID=2901381 RepID=UPI001F25524C|nr:YisL family protein [Cytobacillus spongiae]UII56950.1 YisL family protein [Cytobacillus spongiae]
MTHAHITTWFIAIVLFFVALSLHKSGKAKGFKVVQMILRLLYLLIIATGALLLFSISTITLSYIIKSLLGLWVIAMLEMILIKTSKNEKTTLFWAQFVIALVLVIYLGFKLPLGIPVFG